MVLWSFIVVMLVCKISTFKKSAGHATSPFFMRRLACHLWLARCWFWQNLHFLIIYGICKIDFPILLGHLLQCKVCLHVLRRTAAGLIHGLFWAKSTFSVHCNFSLAPHLEKRKMFLQPRHRQVIMDKRFHCLAWVIGDNKAR